MDPALHPSRLILPRQMVDASSIDGRGLRLRTSRSFNLQPSTFNRLGKATPKLWNLLNLFPHYPVVKDPFPAASTKEMLPLRGCPPLPAALVLTRRLPV
jgi:hypothetical protein